MLRNIFTGKLLSKMLKWILEPLKSYLQQRHKGAMKHDLSAA